MSTNIRTLSGSEMIVGGTISMPMDMRMLGNHEVEQQERQEDHEADRECRLQLADEERRNDVNGRHFFDGVRHFDLGDLENQREILLTRLADHEFAQRPHRLRHRGFERDLVVGHGLDAVRVCGLNAGAIVNSVRNSARLTSTMFGGVSCMPNA